MDGPDGGPVRNAAEKGGRSNDSGSRGDSNYDKDQSGNREDVDVAVDFSNLAIGCSTSEKRKDYLEWPEYFMAVAFLSAMRSKDPCSQVGACIVDEQKRIVGVGYNGMPTGCSDDDLPWGKVSTNRLETKYMYVCHAEMNAIMNKNSANLRGCSLYVALFPCNECAKLVIQAGIKEVIYVSDKHSHKPETVASKLMFDMARVSYRQFTPSHPVICVDFRAIDHHPDRNRPPQSDDQEPSL